MIYRLIFRLLLQRLDPETAHGLAAGMLKAVSVMPGGLRLLRALCGRPDRCLSVNALGLCFPSPLGVAAGVDKDASWFEALGALGFGFVEVGTLTAVGQAGNERPRVFRIPGRRALLNRMGFPNQGAGAAAQRLRCRGRGRDAGERAASERLSRRRGRTIVGANVGKSRVAPLEGAAEDYGAAVAQVAPFCDYLAVNVSSPNTPGLRELQARERLRAIIGAIRAQLAGAGLERPILVKISPDLEDAQIDELADVALELSLDGIVAVNTTLDRRGVQDCPEIAGIGGGGGGVSGPPLAGRSLYVLRRLRARVGDRLALVSVGGIETADDAWERILAGATLIQGYTGFVYGGPAWARRINRGLAQHVRDAGGSSIRELVGAEAAARPSPGAG